MIRSRFAESRALPATTEAEVSSPESVADLGMRREVEELPFYLRAGYHIELAADGWVSLACGCVWITGSALNPATPPPQSIGVCAGQASQPESPSLEALHSSTPPRLRG